MPKIRQHVNPLKSDLLTIAAGPRIGAPPGHFLEVELGSAESLFLMERAAVVADALLVGVEIRREMVVRANRLCAEAGVTGVRNVFANISVDLPRLFAPRSVTRFHINFPDPWFKSRQHKRRVVAPALVEQLAHALKVGGEVSVMTDIFDIALEAMAVLESHHVDGIGFVNARAPWSFWARNPWDARSRRERQCEIEGQKIWRLLYRTFETA
ncbi:MAG: tRNA (guanosine(46)-N7)-methyltransferase TrmB [Deltaproteobacteria bacterium]|nr:tRNA (guanosine(46)-N7)-methyltransferase TrmB [Deltaproteobacteria bacterium]